MTERRASWVDNCDLKPNWTLDRRLRFERNLETRMWTILLEGKESREMGLKLEHSLDLGIGLTLEVFQTRGKFLLN